MSDIAYLDGKILKPFFKLLRKSGLSIPVTGLALKVVEYIGNGPLPKGKNGLGRTKWQDFDRIILTGQSHLDAAWRWRTKQGIIKARATFKKALDHIEDPSLPYFTFTQPSPCYYQWMKDYFPDIYERMKKAVAAGRFIPFGGMWVEADCNMPNGEAFVRQRLYGQRFYLKEFGMMSDVEFLQDVFGFNQNLPQILKKSGTKIFGTGKLFWNKGCKIPLGMCHWQSPDGTKLPMIHINFGYFLPMTYGKDYPLIYLLGKPGKELTANYTTKPKAYRKWRSREYMKENVFGYGLGDGGHGPIEFEVDVVEAIRRMWPDKVKHHQAGDFYAMFKKFFPRWATWNDEWYLAHHRGTYTSVSRVKRGNRDTENAMEDCEKLGSIAQVMGIDVSREEYEKYWKIVLYNQFHDILPGSSIPEVYIEYDDDYKQVMDFTSKINREINSKIMNYICNDSKFGQSFLVYNSLSWNRDDLVQIILDSDAKGAIKDHNGNLLRSQIVENIWGSRTNTENTKIALVKIDEIPSLGFNLLYFDNKSATEVTDKSDEDVVLIEEDKEIVLENNMLKVQISKKTGLIKSIFEKSEEKQFLNKPGNKILIFKETDHCDAWNIDPKYNEKKVDYNLEEIKLDIIENGPLRSTIQITRTIEKSNFVQRISLSAGSDMLILDMDIDLKDEKRMVKLEFDTPIETNMLTSEISYSYIDRAITPTTRLEASRWEQSCQKFASIFDEKSDLGFTITNNGKYGMNALPSETKGTILRPTVVRSPKFSGYYPETMFVNRGPDGGIDPALPHFTDIELHKNVQYGIVCHKGDWRKGSWKRAYEQNSPIRISLKDAIIEPESSSNSSEVKTQLTLPLSFMKLSAENVQCGTFKIAEDDDKVQPTQYIVRLVERTGKQTTTTLDFADFFKIKDVTVVDLLEFNETKDHDLSFSENKIDITIQPYEILSLKISTNQ